MESASESSSVWSRSYPSISRMIATLFLHFFFLRGNVSTCAANANAYAYVHVDSVSLMHA